MSKTRMPPHGNHRYPWDRWEDGNVHTAVRGQHFAVDPESFRTAVHVRASTRKLKAVTRVRGDSVIFQFVKPTRGAKAGR